MMTNEILKWRCDNISPTTIEKYINELNKIGCTSFIINKEDIKENFIMSCYNDVNHPSHYTEGRKYEPIDVITDWNLDFTLGNTVKYISRAGRKTSAAMSDIEKEIQDLEKAKFYLNYRLAKLYKERDLKNNSDNIYQE